MKKLRYTFKTDTLFKMLFVKYPELLKELVAELLGIPLESIEKSDFSDTIDKVFNIWMDVFGF